MSDSLGDIRFCLAFWSRLPVAAGEARSFARAIRALPIAGLVIALPSATVLFLAHAASLPALVGAGLALAASVATTGALHEDGLADTADGLFGGATRERRLDIMRDSRIGTFGAVALGLSLLIRAGALASLQDVSAVLAGAALLSAAAVSRTAGLLPLACLAPARTDGFGARAAEPERGALQTAFLLAAVTLLLPIAAGVSVSHAIVAGALAVCAAYALVPLARAKLGGQTGDIAGASQQLSEIAFLAVLSCGTR